MKIAFFVSGAAGDLFPILALAKAAQQEGSDVLLGTTRSLAGFGAAAKLRTVSFGIGAEIRALADDALYGVSALDRYGAWDHYYDQYVSAELPHALRVCQVAIDSFRPDLIVSSAFVPSAALAADAAGIPWTAALLLPQLLDQPGSPLTATDFAPRFRHSFHELSKATRGRPMPVTEALVPANRLILHDPLLLDAMNFRDLGGIGLPFVTAGPMNSESADAPLGETRTGERPRVVLTFGSLLTSRLSRLLTVIAQTCLARGLSVSVVGPGAPVVDHPRYSSAGWANLPELFSSSDVVVHHGGLGTTFACLRAAKPSVAVPVTFDQPWNAAATEALGVARVATPEATAVVHCVDDLLTDPLIHERVASVSDALIPSETAIMNALSLLTKSIR